MKIAHIIPLILATPLFADDASVQAVKVAQSGGNWNFSVTLLHGDTGWDDYADGWRVVLEDGTELGYRKLHHPHENEQPFTRSLGGVEIPGGIERVYVEASTNTDGWGAARFPVDLK